MVASRKPSKEFWEDVDWAREHYAELQKQYKDVWVAIVNKRVASCGKDLADAEKIGRKLGREVYYLFVESGQVVTWSIF